MKYIETFLGTQDKPKTLNWFQIFFILCVSLLIPRANPDFDDKYKSVKKWWLEIDELKGLPEREIGFNYEDMPIVIGPTKKNMGFWTDSNAIFDYVQHTHIDSDTFENTWRNFINQNRNIKI